MSGGSVNPFTPTIIAIRCSSGVTMQHKLARVLTKFCTQKLLLEKSVRNFNQWQWRRLHRARGGGSLPPHFYKWLGTEGGAP